MIEMSMGEAIVTGATIVLTHATYKAVPDEHKRETWYFCKNCMKWTFRTIRTKGAYAAKWTMWYLTTPFRR